MVGNRQATNRQARTGRENERQKETEEINKNITSEATTIFKPCQNLKIFLTLFRGPKRSANTFTDPHYRYIYYFCVL